MKDENNQIIEKRETISDVKARIKNLSFFFCDYNGLESLYSSEGNVNTNVNDT